MPSIADQLPDVPKNAMAEARGRTRMRRYRFAEKLRADHDYGKHRADLHGDCDFCLMFLDYSLRHMSDAYFCDPNEVPKGFRK